VDDGCDPAAAPRPGRLGAPEGPHRRRRARRGDGAPRGGRGDRCAGHSLGKLGDVRYWFNWDGERIFKVVSFFLVRYVRGRLGDLSEAFRHEVAEVRWVPLEEAPKLLTYGGEKDIARKAWERLSGEGV